MSHIPYGYKIENGKAVIDEEKAYKIMSLYKSYISGLSYKLASEAAGLKIQHAGAKRMMQNKYYLGDDYYPSIIDKDTFDAAEAERIKRQIRLGRVFDEKPAEAIKLATNFKISKVEYKYEDPFRQAEFIYSLIEGEVEE